MKTKTLFLAAVMLVWLLSVTKASAFYDPGAQRWINRDPLGDMASSAHQAAGVLPWKESNPEDGLTEGDARNTWLDINRNLFGAIGNDPVNSLDFFGLERVLVCTRPGPNGMPIPIYAEKETLGNASMGAPRDNAPTGSSDVFAEEFASAYGELALAATGEGAISKLAQVANRNRYLRIGLGPVPGASQRQFRVAFGGRDKFVHGHIDSTNWYKPWNWFQKLGSWKNYGCK